MVKGFGLTGVAGLASGLVFLSVIAGGTLGVLLIYLVPLPLMMVGLSLGLLNAVAASAVAVAVVGLAMAHAIPSFALVAVAPALALVWQSLLWRPSDQSGGIEWSSPGRVLSVLTGVAVGLMLLGAAILASQGQTIVELIHDHVVQFVDQMAGSTPAEMRDALIGMWSALMPAMAACAWLVIATLNGMLAQWTVTKAERAIRPTPSYGDLSLPVWLSAGLAVAAAIGLLAPGDLGYVARNAAVVLLWPHVLLGLTAVHQLMRDRPNRVLWLTLFYVAFMVLFQWALFAVAGFGLVRHWTRPRRRDAGGQEEK